MKSDINVSYSDMTGDKETGRSMVEMLGVLAIIGVLSVVGISGYTMAMHKYRANEIIARASTLYMFDVINKDISKEAHYGALDEAGLDTPYGNVNMSVSVANGEYTINVTGAGEAVCNVVDNSFGSGHDFKISCS